MQSLSSQHSEWDLISDGELELLQERLSVASLDSDESDAVIIFGGSRGRVVSSNESCAQLSVASSKASLPESVSSWKSSNKIALMDKEHERLVNAVSGLSKDPALQKVAKSLESSPIEDRLLQQISKLAQDLDDSQAKTKSLRDENSRLLLENDELKSKTDNQNYKSRKYPQPNQSPTAILVRAGISLAVAVFIVTQLRRKLLGVSAAGAFVVAGGCGLYGYLKTDTEAKGCCKLRKY